MLSRCLGDLRALPREVSCSRLKSSCHSRLQVGKLALAWHYACHLTVHPQVSSGSCQVLYHLQTWLAGVWDAGCRGFLFGE